MVDDSAEEVDLMGAKEEAQVETRLPVDYEFFVQSVNADDMKNAEKIASDVLPNKKDDPVILNGLAHLYRKSGKNGMAKILIDRVCPPLKEQLRQLLAEALAGGGAASTQQSQLFGLLGLGAQV